MDKKFYIIGGCVLLVTLACAWGLSGLTKHLIVAVDKWGEAAPQLVAQTKQIADGMNGTQAILARIGGEHGTLAMVDEDVGSLKSLIVHADLVARHEQQQATTWDTRGTALFNNINGEVSDLRDTTKAATTAINQLNDAKTGLPVLLAAATGAINHIDAAVTSVTPPVVAAATSAASTAKHVDSAASNVDKAVDKALNPPQLHGWAKAKSRLEGVGEFVAKLVVLWAK